ncbi:monooxygenase FAD-binding [Catenulispora acidiphila DSM 44928]|uniref:Monooxygenase FAD-binding n=1 Tax=Catenulispora acidiphila (strain DSM 44928 / JCM 14897 / NBRC 102108 / NRRL B-24433 / ID139908) TaxID=479433 RepID=C7PWF8_CATAD|nr:FAD-dependent monooxygenase [Catenulispora acidiphila]ACU75238.1 monooxygenase FAD-binding [Catenulispora acidiphila DSM 44928]
MPEISGGRAVVLGASMAGLMAARVLREKYERVTVVERDVLPAGPEHRRGVPQSRHLHVLLARGTSIIEELFPGFVAEAVAAGATPADALARTRLLVSGYRLLQTDVGLQTVLAGRPLVEHIVRGRVRALDGVDFLDGHDVVSLAATADGRRVTGVRVQSDGGTEEMLEADLVLDATGRGSRSPVWLEQLGHGRPEVDKVQVGLSYATLTYRLPDGAMGKDQLMLNNATPGHQRAAVLSEQENGLFRLTMAGMLGDRPPLDRKGFDAFAASLRFPDIFEAVRDGEALHDPVGFQYPANIRHRYERMRSFPEGFLILGDAICSFNPVYGQGMTSAAMQAEALRGVLADDRGPTWKRHFRAMATAVDPAWQISAGGDLVFPGVVGHRTPLIRMINAYLPRVHAAAAEDVEISTRFIRVADLVDRPEALVRPATALRVLGRRRAKPEV